MKHDPYRFVRVQSLQTLYGFLSLSAADVSANRM